MHNAGWIQKVKSNLKGSLQDLKKLSKQLSKEQANQKKAEAAAIKQRQRIEAAVTDEDRKVFLASIRGTKRLKKSNRIESGPGSAQPNSRETAFFKQKRAQAEGRDILASERRRSSADTPPSRPLPAHAHAGARTEAAHLSKLGEYRDDGAFIRTPDAADVIKKLQRGQWPVEASLDLHGSTLDDAAERFDRFMHSCIEHGVRCVCVIHGQGFGSKDNKPVLRDAVRSWLRDLAAVTAYVTAPENIGGAGAVLILLRNK